MAIIYRNPRIVTIAAELDYDTAGFGTGILIGELPVGCRIMFFNLIVQTQFNASGSNLFHCGISPTGLELAVNVNINVAADTIITPGKFAQLNPLSATRSIYARYVQAGTPATAGKVHVHILAVEQ